MLPPSGPDWMSELPEGLWDVPLTELAIPGSHDAMSYCLDINSPLVQSEGYAFRTLDRLCCCFTRRFIYQWATTQDRKIYEQLSMGIRYFDFRVAAKPNDSSCELYFAHMIYTHLTVMETMQSIALWQATHPKEVVILACSHFEGISDTLHQLFISFLKQLFGSKLCPQTKSTPTLRSMWTSGQQVILSYDSDSAAGHPELWPGLPYWWANERTADGVVRYLECKKAQGRPGGFFVCGLNLTADRRYIVDNWNLSLRKLTFNNWQGLRGWLEQQTPGSGHKCLNIVAGDFVGSLPLCSLVVALNQKLLPQNRKK